VHEYKSKYSGEGKGICTPRRRSLGAYGAGVYSRLYESLSKMDIEEGNKGKPIFDIIAGTSIGAINAAVLVSYVNFWNRM
jgi:hypothetical protein